MNSKSFFLILKFFLIFQTFTGQVYLPIDTANYEKRKQIAKDYQKNQKSFIKSLKNEFSGNELTYAKKIFQENKDEFSKEILKGDYIFHDSIDILLNQIVIKLQQTNPSIPYKTNFYVSRIVTLNAMSMADNSFIINLGTFYFLNNEQQLAAIICHEFAHSILKHHFSSIKNSHKTETDKARKDIEHVKQSRYGRGSRAMERYKGILYDKGKMKRQYEFEADSLGYVLFKNSGYKPSEYINALQLIAEYDSIQPNNLDSTIYRKMFDLPNLQFNENWLKMEDFSAYDYTKYKEKFDKDSIKSHPELTERIKKLETIFQELKEKCISEKPSDLFVSMNRIAKYEMLPSLDFSEEYGLGVYACLWGMTDDDLADKIFYEQWLGKFFAKILQARKEYNLNRYLERVDPRNHSYSYQQFLNFMWNLKVSEIEQISNYYNKGL